MATRNTSVQPALLFMPDISGFTEFVNATEIMHAQSIIQEVLEVLIESNELHMEVGEIEGDAVFFYRLGEAPPLPQLFQQIRSMYTKFHQHLQLYDLQRICPCAACTSASRLKLKMIAHFGEVAGYSVKNHHKLFGRDVIVLHRLLKNRLEKKEYALLTRPLLSEAEGATYPDWFHAEQSREQYDVGEVEFTVADLSVLRLQVPRPKAPVYGSRNKTRIGFSEEAVLSAPAQKIFGTIFDISQRPRWMDGVKNIIHTGGDHINRVGTTHRCITGNKSNRLIVTEFARIYSDGAELVEMDGSGIGGCRFEVKALDKEESKLRIDVLVRNHFFLRWFFQLFLKKRLQKQIRRSIYNLGELCKDPFARKRTAVENLN